MVLVVVVEGGSSGGGSVREEGSLLVDNVTCSSRGAQELGRLRVMILAVLSGAYSSSFTSFFSLLASIAVVGRLLSVATAEAADDVAIAAEAGESLFDL